MWSIHNQPLARVKARWWVPSSAVHLPLLQVRPLAGHWGRRADQGCFRASWSALSGGDIIAAWGDVTTLTPECSVGTRAGRWECSMVVLGKAFQRNGCPSLSREAQWDPRPKSLRWPECGRWDGRCCPVFPLSTGHYQKMTLRLKPAVVSFTGVAGSYFPQGSGSQFGMHSRVTWEIISLSPDTHTASSCLHPDNKNLRRLSQYFF